MKDKYFRIRRFIELLTEAHGSILKIEFIEDGLYTATDVEGKMVYIYDEEIHIIVRTPDCFYNYLLSYSSLQEQVKKFFSIVMCLHETPLKPMTKLEAVIEEGNTRLLYDRIPRDKYGKIKPYGDMSVTMNGMCLNTLNSRILGLYIMMDRLSKDGVDLEDEVRRFREYENKN